MKFFGISNRIKIFSLAFCLISFSLQAQTAKQVVYGDDFVFNLDYETSFEAYGPVRYKDYFAFYNPVNFSIKLFDQESLSVASTINIAQEGPKSMYQSTGLMADEDDIYVFSYYKQSVYAVNEKGRESFKYVFKQEDNTFGGYLATGTSVASANDEFIYVPILAGHDIKTMLADYRFPSIVRINKSDSSVSTFLNYPKNYKNMISGGLQGFISSTLHPKTESLIVSYPLSHTVFELTKNGGIKEHSMKSSAIDDFDGHYYKSQSDIKSEKSRAKYLENPSFSRLHYDAYSNTYWRFVNLPLTYSQMNQKEVIEAKARNYKVVVFDANFNKIAESDILKDINLTLSAPLVFSTEKGIHIYAKSQENEEEMRFKTLKIK